MHAEFASAAHDYCTLVEQADQLERSELLQRLQTTLGRLVALASELPEVWPVEDGSEAQRREPPTAVSRALEDLPGHWDIYDPWVQRRPRSDLGSLADDLADVYLDLAEGLDLLVGGAPRAAMWEWRFSFWCHWGRHATGALRAIHTRLADG